MLDQKLIGRAQQVGEFEVLITEPVLIEVVDELPQFLIRKPGFAHLPVKVDVPEHALQFIGVLPLQGPQRHIELVAHILVHFIPDVGPPRLLGHEEDLAAKRLIVSPHLCLLAAAAFCDVLFYKNVVALLKHIGDTLQKEHAEDVLLEFGGIHLTAEDIDGDVEMALELGKGKFSRHRYEAASEDRGTTPGGGSKESSVGWSLSTEGFEVPTDTRLRKSGCPMDSILPRARKNLSSG